MNLRPPNARGLGRLSILAALATVPGAVPAMAHPEVWISATVAPIIDRTGRFVSVHETWAFDYEYSALMAPRLDLTRTVGSTSTS